MTVLNRVFRGVRIFLGAMGFALLNMILMGIHPDGLFVPAALGALGMALMIWLHKD